MNLDTIFKCENVDLLNSLTNIAKDVAVKVCFFP